MIIGIRGPSEKLDLEINALDFFTWRLKGAKGTELGKGGVSVETVTLGDVFPFHNLPLMILTWKSDYPSFS